MKKFRFLFALLIAFISIRCNAQWIKLPTPYLPNYWPWVVSGVPPNATIVFPAFLMPSENGHVFIGAFYDNGSVSSNSSYYEVFESFDDLSSHTSLSSLGKISNLYAGNFNIPYGGIKAPIYRKKDSSFSWIEHAKYTYVYKNKYTKNGFQTIDSTDYCHPMGPPNIVANYLTDHYMYSAQQAIVTGNDDSLSIGRSNLATGTTSCKKLVKYNGLNGVLKAVNDSTVLFYCTHRTNPSKKFLLKTIDYGSNWNEIFVDSVNVLLDYRFTSIDTGYVLLNNNTFLKTINGGNSWSPLPIPTATLTCFSFFNNNLGYIGGAQGFLSKTTDGGQTWNNEISGTTHQLKEIFTVNDSVAYFKDGVSSLYKNTEIIISVKENEIHKGFIVFPNPVCNTLSVQSANSEIGLVIIYNLLGEVVLQKTISENNSRLDVSELSPGIYNLKIKESYTRIISNCLNFI